MTPEKLEYERIVVICNTAGICLFMCLTAICFICWLKWGDK